jgi:hypothetical protein
MIKKQFLTFAVSTILLGSSVGPTFASANANIENAMDTPNVLATDDRSIVKKTIDILSKY